MYCCLRDPLIANQIREHHEALRKYVDDQGKRDMQEAEEVEKIAGSGCTCGLQLEPTILDKLLENLARFPRPVARIVGLYLPPKTTPKIEVSKQQAEIIGRVIAGQNVFFTGKAGTGKTFLLKQVCTSDHFRQKLESCLYSSAPSCAAAHTSSQQ